MTVLTPHGIVVTGDVHSHLEHAPLLLDGLARAGQGMLIADSGDCFEGTGSAVARSNARSLRACTTCSPRATTASATT